MVAHWTRECSYMTSNAAVFVHYLDISTVFHPLWSQVCEEDEEPCLFPRSVQCLVSKYLLMWTQLLLVSHLIHIIAPGEHMVHFVSCCQHTWHKHLHTWQQWEMTYIIWLLI
jgi:hypothetical protein